MKGVLHAKWVRIAEEKHTNTLNFSTTYPTSHSFSFLLSSWHFCQLIFNKRRWKLFLYLVQSFSFPYTTFSHIHNARKFLSIIYSSLFRSIHSLNAWKLSNFHKLLWWKFYSFIFLLFLSLPFTSYYCFCSAFFSWTEATHKFYFNYMPFMSGSWILAYLNDNF